MHHPEWGLSAYPKEAQGMAEDCVWPRSRSSFPYTRETAFALFPFVVRVPEPVGEKVVHGP